MKVLLLAVAGLVAVNAVALKSVMNTRSMSPEEMVDYINNVQTSWKAKVSPRFSKTPNAVKSRLMGVKKIEVPAEYRANQVDTIRADIPTTFDARSAWPQCPGISNIRDQSSCGSCWAFGAAEAMSDRTCIQTNGQFQDPLSADDILACCGFSCGDGCEGGYPIDAWQYWVHKGVVTGGNFTSKYGCMPYPFAPCEHHTDATHYQPCPADIYPTPKCTKQCQNGWANDYNADKHYGKSAYAVSSNVQAIQTELMTNGPLEVSFNVYEDFEHYTSGVYVHTTGQMLGGHAVKLVGWGTDAASGLDYWFIANSWNTDWGDNGYFKIVRGRNECGIEGGVVGGLAKV